MQIRFTKIKKKRKEYGTHVLNKISNLLESFTNDPECFSNEGLAIGDSSRKGFAKNSECEAEFDLHADE